MAFYLDTSAAVKLVVAERGSTQLLRWMSEHQDRIVSSDLLRTELQRATRRGAPQEMERARAVLESVTVMTLVRSTFERAAELEPELSGALMLCISRLRSNWVTTSKGSLPTTIASLRQHTVTASG